jgi:hypothetical protein
VVNRDGLELPAFEEGAAVAIALAALPAIDGRALSAMN